MSFCSSRSPSFMYKSKSHCHAKTRLTVSSFATNPKSKHLILPYCTILLKTSAAFSRPKYLTSQSWLILKKIKKSTHGVLTVRYPPIRCCASIITMTNPDFRHQHLVEECFTVNPQNSTQDGYVWMKETHSGTNTSFEDGLPTTGISCEWFRSYWLSDAYLFSFFSHLHLGLSSFVIFLRLRSSLTHVEVPVTAHLRRVHRRPSRNRRENAFSSIIRLANRKL